MKEYKKPIDHARLKKMVQAFVDATSTNAIAARKDRDYFDGNQISAAVLSELEKRGQPPIYTNRVVSAISGMLGILDSGASDPEAMPRVPRAADAADVVTKTLRFLADRANYKRVRKVTSKEYLIEGSCAVSLEWNGRSIDATPIRWSEFVYDPFSIEYDFADAGFLGVAKMRDCADVEADFPDTYVELGRPDGDMLSFFDDDSKKNWWSDPLRKRVRVVDLYYLHRGEWHRAVFVEAGMLYSGTCEYVDDLGVSMCPIRAVSYEITRAGDRYGAIRNMIPLQDSVNARNSRLLHLVNHRQTRQTDQFAPPENKALARREASKADGTIPYGWEAVSSPDLAQGQMMVLTNDMAALDRMAPTPAVLGQVTASNQSGRARQILQQAGYTELARSFGRFEDFELSIYRTMWCMARQYFSQPEVIRITDDPRAPEFLTINEPVMGPVPVPAMHPATGEPVLDPYTGQPMMTTGIGQIAVKNRLAELDMDVILTTVPDTATLEQETFATLLEYASSNRISPFQPEFWAMLEMSTLPNKRATIEKLQRLADEAQQKQAAGQEAAQQMAQQREAVDMQGAQAKAAKHTAEAEKTSVETEMLRQAEIAKANAVVAEALRGHPLIEGSIYNAPYGQAYR